MFLRIPAVLGGDLLSSVIASLSSEDAPWVDGRATAGHLGAQVKRNQQLEESSSMARELGDQVIAQLEHHPSFISAVLPNRVHPPLFNRYAAGMGFGSHVDGAVRTIPGTAQRLRTDLSATLFLVAPEAYEGGELVIESDFGNESAKFNAGDLLVYSAASRHRVNAVTHGTRLACVFWIQSLVRDDDNRQRLFELDRTIQALTGMRADADSVVRLTALYHSLLRLWSDV